MASWESPHRVRLPSTQQRWHGLTLVHEGYPPEQINRLLPNGLVADTYDGLAWVGIAAFRMHAAVLPVVPGPRVTVGEANVRTYVRDRQGNDGIWFFSLDLEQPIVALGLRVLVGLPYRWARTQMTFTPTDVRYRTIRRDPHRPAGLRLHATVEDRLPARDIGTFETFLVGRWRAYSLMAGQLVSVPVDHEPWVLHRASLVVYDQDLTRRLALPQPATDRHTLFAPGFDARLGWPRRVI